VPLDSQVSFHDIIRGDVTIDTNLLDDQVLMKSDGYPTYHFANVVDDHLMGITHVIRGEEWLTSVPKHILLYKAFGWEMPQLAHVPLILNPDRSKLSKRQGDVATEDFLKKGYLPEVLINFIAFLGWNPGETVKEEIFSLEELVKLFSLERVNSAGAIFNYDKLNWMNAEYIKSYDLKKLTELAVPFLEAAGFDTSDSAKNERVIYAVKTYINKLDEIKEHAAIYYKRDFNLDEEQKSILNSDSSKKVFNLMIQKLEGFNLITADNFKPVLSEVQKETGVKGKNLFMPVRLALTGEEHGPELGLVAYVLGKDELVRRIQKYT
jgi:glutamyl-tRNA synthetase